MWYHLSHARVLKLDKLVSMHMQEVREGLGSCEREKN